MQNKYKKIFSKIEFPEPSDGLLEGIMGRIAEERRLTEERRRFVIFSFSSIGSLAVLVFAFNFVQSGLSDSGFFQFFSLLFSDFSIIADYWESFAVSLLSALPVTGLIIFFGSVWALANSVRYLVKNASAVLNLRFIN